MSFIKIQFQVHTLNSSTVQRRDSDLKKAIKVKTLGNIYKCKRRVNPNKSRVLMINYSMNFNLTSTSDPPPKRRAAPLAIAAAPHIRRTVFVCHHRSPAWSARSPVSALGSSLAIESARAPRRGWGGGWRWAASCGGSGSSSGEPSACARASASSWRASSRALRSSAALACAVSRASSHTRRRAPGFCSRANTGRLAPPPAYIIHRSDPIVFAECERVCSFRE